MQFYSKRSMGMSIHYADVKGGLVSLLAEIGLVEPNVEATAVEPLPPLSAEQELLVACWRSGQIEPSVWLGHLNEDPVLAAHFRRPAVMH
jgi:hypothetical protein